MRSENVAPAVDCDDAMVKAACLIDDASCPAACKTTEEPTEPTVVKAGDLAVSATAAAGRKVLIGNASDLDTLTFRTSEEVTLSKVVLERYGYSTNDDIERVWLEDENGNVISNDSNGLDSKGQAKLTIKKDYKKVDGTYNATIVVETKQGLTGGKTMGFKVVSVDSTAANLNINNYKPYTYDLVNYDGVNVTFTARGTTKDYNYVAGEAYEVSKFKVKAPADSAILVRGFTLTNTGANQVDVERYLDKVVVTANGKDIRAKYNVNRDKQLVVSFNDVEAAAKQNVEFVVTMSFTEDFEDYGKSIRYQIVKTTDFAAIDAKTESRVDASGINSVTAWPVYNFLGGKVKLSNTKVGNVEAAYGSVDVKVAEGSISTTETLRGTFTIYAKNAIRTGMVNGVEKSVSAINTMKVTIAGEEYEVTAPSIATATVGGTYDKGTLVYSKSTKKLFEALGNPSSWTSAGCQNCRQLDGVPYTFKNVDIEKSGKVTVVVDVEDMPEFENAKVEFSTLNADAFSELTYDDVRSNSNNNATGQIAGFVTLYNLTVKPGKAAFKNNLTKAVEFIKSETNNKVVFDGVYTAKNGTVNLTDWTISGTEPSTLSGKVTFYLSIDGDEIDDVKMTSGTVKSSISNVRINEGEEVKVVVTAEVEATQTGDYGTYAIAFEGEDNNGNKAGSARANTVAIKVVEKGSVTISSDAAAKATVLRKTAGAEIAQFTVKPSNGSSEVDLETISFVLSGASELANFDEYDVTLTIGDSDETITVTPGTDSVAVEASPYVTLPSNGLVVKVTAERELTGTIVLTGLMLNAKTGSRTYSKRFEDAVVRIVAQKDLGGSTQFTIEVDADSDATVSALKIGLDNAAPVAVPELSGIFGDGDTFELKGTGDVAQYITSIQYDINNNPIPVIEKSEYNDFFKVGDTYARVFKA